MIYFDNSATTKPSAECIAEMNKALIEVWGNPSSLHKLGIEAEKLMIFARLSIAKKLGAEEDEIFFTSGGTEANNLAIFGAVEANKRKGKRVVTTAVEHHSVSECFDKLESEGYEVVRLMPDRDGKISEEAIKNAITADTVLVSIMLVNNETGVIFPVKAARKAIDAKKAPAILHTDAVQGFGKIKFKARDLGADLITVSSHKIEGPKGVGALYKSAKCRILPRTIGGGQERNLRSGTEPLPAIAGFGKASEMLDYSAESKIKELNGYLREKLCEFENVVINSPEDASPYILGISVLGYRSETLLHFLEARDIYVSSGSACAKGKGSHVLGAMGLPQSRIDGALRLSFSASNTKEEADAFCDALSLAISTLRSSTNKR